MGTISEDEFKALMYAYKVILLNIKSVRSIGEFIGCIMMLGAYINLYFYKVDNKSNKYCFGAGIVRNNPNSKGIAVICELRNMFAHFTDIGRAMKTFDSYKAYISTNENSFDNDVIDNTILMLKEFDTSEIDKLFANICSKGKLIGLSALDAMSIKALEQ